MMLWFRGKRNVHGDIQSDDHCSLKNLAYLASLISLADVIDISLSPVVIFAHDDRVHAPHFAFEGGGDSGVPSSALHLFVRIVSTSL